MSWLNETYSLRACLCGCACRNIIIALERRKNLQLDIRFTNKTNNYFHILSMGSIYVCTVLWAPNFIDCHSDNDKFWITLDFDPYIHIFLTQWQRVTPNLSWISNIFVPHIWAQINFWNLTTLQIQEWSKILMNVFKSLVEMNGNSFST